MAKMTKEAAARIQSAEAKAHGGKVARGSFAARAMAAASRDCSPLENAPSTTGRPSGKNRGNKPPKK